MLYIFLFCDLTPAKVLTFEIKLEIFNGQVNCQIYNQIPSTQMLIKNLHSMKKIYLNNLNFKV